MMKKWFIVSLLVLLGAAGVFWLGKELVKPLPGEAVADLGREHVPDGTKVNYNSNPPTSGPHYADWTRAGIYENPISDGHLIHSSPSAELKDDVWSSSKCQDLKKNLSDLANEKKLSKLIVIPRPNLDSPIALTAWTRIDKFDSFDKERINRFIDTFRDQGPEKTRE
ncbi:MAG: DUF3105 domain-containing protein [Candidatus Levybacteria bacterium]|nr:DUF3105 domain-containing protein [Candidatus Levybacteria bacterium]